jgi:hypothetical protein
MIDFPYLKNPNTYRFLINLSIPSFKAISLFCNFGAERYNYLSMAGESVTEKGFHTTRIVRLDRNLPVISLLYSTVRNRLIVAFNTMPPYSSLYGDTSLPPPPVQVGEGPCFE